jgi:transcriptional regulator with XRE-family HTH domain
LAVNDNELGAFLRAHREAIAPADVGLPNGTRRRTQGLRRAELAALAGISVEYLTRLEQGRDRHPSFQVLAALADALHLSTGYERLAGPSGLLDARRPSLVRYVFSDVRARSTYPEWDRVADERVASFRAAFCPSDAYGAALANELATVAGAAFADRFHAPPVVPNCAGIERVVHPGLGELRLAYETLDLARSDGQCVVVYLPADDATFWALDALELSGSRTAVNSSPSVSN